MTFYSTAILLTELMMIAMILHVIRYSGFTKQQKVWFILTFASIMLCSVAEFAVHCGYYDPKFSIPLTILTVVQFSIAPFLGAFFSGALGLYKPAKIASIFFSTNFLVEAVLAPFGLIFVFNENGYSRGPAFIIYEIFFFISLAYLMISMIIIGRKFQHRDVLTILMVVAIIIAGIVPMVLFKINITYIAIAISASLCYIYYNDLVQQDTLMDVSTHQRRITQMQTHIISGLANLIESRDLETGEHIFRTSNYTKLIAEKCIEDGVYTDQIDDRFVTLIFDTSPLHDIGKIVVSDTILRKPGKLTPEEFEAMKQHAAVGGKVVREVLSGVSDTEYIIFASDVATYHHERWDGNGYPKNLKGEEIPLSARIMAIADVFDALVSERCYKKAMSPEKAFDIIEEEAGTHFDPTLAAVFLNHKEDVLLVLNSSPKVDIIDA